MTSWIYTPDGKPVAGYRRDRGSQTPALPTVPPGQREAYWFQGNQVLLVSSIVLQGKPVGIVYIESSLQEMNDRLKRYAGIVAVVLSSSLIAALLISSIFQRAIAQPIVRLADTARIVSRDKNYSVRAASSGNRDELAVLIEAFNEMLGQIQERETRLQQLAIIVASSDDAIFSKTLEGVIVSWNTGAERMYGYSSEDVIGRPVSLLAPSDRVDEIPEILERVKRGEHIVQYEAVHVRKDGKQIDVGMTISPIKDGAGVITGASTISRDITERKRADEQIKELNVNLERRVAERTTDLEASNKELGTSNKELEAFTYSVSHDLRAPLRHIDGFSKLLVEEHSAELSEEAREYVTLIRDSTREMGQLIDDLLNLARVGRKELSLQVTGLDSLVEEVVAGLKSESASRTIEWNVGRLPFVECDPGLMKQVFANLLSNAVKYTRPRERAVIDVGVASENGQPTIFVRDNGVGFNMKNAAKLFGVFQRLHRAEDFEGTGVGLATVQRIIHKHGGRVWADAELDRGATFYFTLRT
jgi:PAS domain S-box-containing protein